MAKRGFAGVMMRGYGARDHEATVTDVEPLAPHFVRVRMSAPTLLQDVVVSPTAWLRFWFPDPERPEFEQQRAYTLSEVDAAAGTFAIDMVLHEPAGPASTWAAAVTPGTTIQVTTLGSSRFDLPDELPAGYLLVGDSASLPAINAILATVPAEVQIELYLEEHSPDDRLIPLRAHPRATVHWVPRLGESSLAAAIESRDWSDWYVWTAPESGSLKHLRTRLRDEFGFPKSETHAQAYWYFGRAFGANRSKAAPEPEADAQVQGSSVAAEPVEPVDPVLPVEPGPPVGSRPTGTGSWRATAGSRLLAPLRPKLIVAGAAQGLVTLLQLAPFVLLVELARLLLTDADASRLWALGWWAVGLMAAGVLLSTALLVWTHVIDARFERELRRRLLRKLSRVPLGWFDARGSGQVKQLVQDDTLALHYLVTHAVPDAVAAVVAPVAVLVYLFAVDWRIALLLLLPVLIYVVAMAIMMVQSAPRTAEAPRWSERMNTEAGSYLEGQPVIRVFGGAAATGFRAKLGEYIDFLGRWQRPLSGQKAFIDLVTRPATFLLLICALGTLLITGGGMDPIALLPFLLLGTTFGSRLLGIGYGLGGLRTGLVAARRIQIALDEPELEIAAPAADAGGDANATGIAGAVGAEAAPRGRVEFDGVGFAYRPGVPVLEDVSLTLEPGTVTALVGPSGSGKSTLAALLARFHEVGAGSIRVGGTELRELEADELYARVGFVFQQTQLVHGTVRENLALARPEAGDAEIEEAARAAQIHERILRLPDGYGTVLGPDAALSGGERQRLTIARAILADTPVLILDEATAFADPESEYLVQRALSRLAAGRTVLVIAHRLHTVASADRIVVLDHGRIAESGTHEELLAGGGRYRSLWTVASGAATAPHETIAHGTEQTR